MQIFTVFVVGCMMLWIVSKIMHFYAPDAKGTGIYYAFALFLMFSMGILDMRAPTIGPDP